MKNSESSSCRIWVWRVRIRKLWGVPFKYSN